MMKKILLLDIENCPQTSASLIQLCKQYHQVELAYATSNLNFNLDALNQLQSDIQNKVLNILKMPNVGKNAADFGLAFTAGQLSQRFATDEAEFFVMSNDHAMTYVVDLLKQHGFKAGLIQTTPVAKPVQSVSSVCTSKVNQANAVKTDQVLQDALKRLMPTLLKLDNLPKKRTSLQNGIQTWAKVDAKMADKIIALLVEQKKITIQDQSVSYTLASKDSKLAPAKSTLEMPPLEDIAKVSHLRDLKTICDYLHKYERTRPSKNVSMQNMIKTLLKIEQTTILKNRYKLLLKYDLITENELGKLSYKPQQIKRWADLILPDFTTTAAINANTQNQASDSEQLLKLATKLDQLNLNKPKFLAGFTVLIQSLFPNVDPQQYVMQLVNNGIIALDDRKIIYQMPLTMH